MGASSGLFFIAVMSLTLLTCQRLEPRAFFSVIANVAFTPADDKLPLATERHQVHYRLQAPPALGHH